MTLTRITRGDTDPALFWTLESLILATSTSPDAAVARAELAAAGEAATSVYTGWDGDPGVRGPWHVNVVRIDPKRFDVSLGASFGPDLYNRETTWALSAPPAPPSGSTAASSCSTPRPAHPATLLVVPPT